MVPRKQINAYPLDDHLILQPALSNQFLVLSPTAGFIWEACRRGASRQDIRSEMTRLYGISRRQAAKDVASVLGALAKAGLLDSAADEKPPVDLQSTPDEQKAFFPILPPKAERVYYSFLGQDFVVLYANRRLREMLHVYLSHFACAQKAIVPVVYALLEENKTYVICKDGQPLERTPDENRVKNRLLQEILVQGHESVSLGAFLHAAAAVRDGYCILLPGGSGSGKSTLTAYLLREGYQYMGDDFIALTASNYDALAAPFALSIKEKSWPVLRPFYPEIDGLPVYSRLKKTVKFLAPSNASLPLAAPRKAVDCIIYPRYVPEAPASLDEIPAVASFQKLMAANAWIDAGESCVAGFIRWLQSKKSYRLSYSRLADAKRLIDEVLKR